MVSSKLSPEVFHARSDPLRARQERRRLECLAKDRHDRLPWPDGRERSVQGSSFAAPVVSGIIALFLERYPGATKARDLGDVLSNTGGQVQGVAGTESGMRLDQQSGQPDVLRVDRPVE